MSLDSLILTVYLMTFVSLTRKNTKVNNIMTMKVVSMTNQLLHFITLDTETGLLITIKYFKNLLIQTTYLHL